MTITLEEKINLRIAAQRGSGPVDHLDPALEAILAKPHDRLLIDAGLTRCGAMGTGRYLWSEWQRGRALWTL